MRTLFLKIETQLQIQNFQNISPTGVLFESFVGNINFPNPLPETVLYRTTGFKNIDIYNFQLTGGFVSEFQDGQQIAADVTNYSVRFSVNGILPKLGGESVPNPIVNFAENLNPIILSNDANCLNFNCDPIKSVKSINLENVGIYGQYSVGNQVIFSNLGLLIYYKFEGE